MDKLLLVGAGGMAVAYQAVFAGMNVNYDVVCRSEASASNFFEQTGVKPSTGGVTAYLRGSVPKAAVVATGVESLYQTVVELIRTGVKSILVEKPGALYKHEISDLKAQAEAAGASVYIAYNRRFYDSVRRLLKMADDDGGITSVHFDFTEWSDRIAPIEKGENVKERWVLSNSTHVIDLAFFLGGRPSELSCYSTGELNWHKSGSAFSGSGRSSDGVIYSYRANWDAPGRWGVWAYTQNYCFELCPLEQLQVTRRNSVEKQLVEGDDQLDEQFKPGLYRQVKAFIDGTDDSLCSLEEHDAVFSDYLSIAGYLDD